MRVAGVDPSSSIAGLAIIDGPEIVEVAAWIPPTGKVGRGDLLMDYHDSLLEWISARSPELAVVLSSASFQQSKKTIKILSEFEGVSKLALRRANVPTIALTDTDTRHLAFQLGGRSTKEQGHAALDKAYPDAKWGQGKAVLDKKDAVIAALAGVPALHRST
jgi:Holliday junction resolvasome RuvABC endonuclease subunit